LSDFVERFWMLRNATGVDKEVVVIPDGRIDLIFTRTGDEPFKVALIGIETVPSTHILPTETVMFGVSMKLLAIEYVLRMDISSSVNGMIPIATGFWGVTVRDLQGLAAFGGTLSTRISAEAATTVDSRKKHLLDLIEASNGSLSVRALSEKVGWGSRQINRYFTEKLGVPLKVFNSIIRFRAAFPELRRGKLFPDLPFTDQAHFIKEVRKYAGVTPKELFRNEDDRFLQLTTTKPR